MKLEILTTKLKESVSICEKITRKVTSLPILNNILLKTEGNFLQSTTTNLETAIKRWVLAKIDKQGIVLVPATFFTNLLLLIDEEKLILEERNKNLFLSSETRHIQIQGQNPDEFPIIPEVIKENPLELPMPKLFEGLSQVVDIPAVSQVRPEISGILFSFKKNKLKIVGTDSFRLGEKTLSLEQEIKKEVSFIVPQEAAKELVNNINQRKGALVCYSNPNQVMFEVLMEETSHPEVNIFSRLIEGEYPNYQEIIPKKFTTRIQIEKERFQNKIKEAGLFSGKIFEVKITPLPKQSKIKVFSQSPETGKSESYLPAKVEGEQFDISFNYKFLAEGLNNIKSSEIIFELNGEEGAAALKPVGDQTYVYILMPVKAS